MKRRVVILLFLLFFSTLFSEESADNDISSYSRVIYEHESSYYDDIYLACMEDGITLLSYKKPLSLAELYLNYKMINSEALSEQGQASYDSLSELFFKNNSAIVSNQFAFDYNVIMALEARYLHNPQNEPNIDKLYRYNTSLEPLKIPLEFYLSKYAYLYFTPTLGKNYSAFNTLYPYTNLPLTQNSLDFHFPKQTGFAVGNSFFNAYIGRGQLTVGRTLSGSMLISDSSDRLDFFNASMFFKFARFDMTIAELSPTSFFISHEISLRPVKQLFITFHEGIMLDSVFDPKFLNPFMIFHNYGAWKQDYVNHTDEKSIGCQLGLDINIVPVKNLRIYGQFGMNQFQTPSELKSGASDVPNSMGGLVGLEYIFKTLGGHLILTGEFEYADPWLYIGKGGHKVSFYSYRNEMVNAKNSYEASRINFWLANPYGPDTILAFLKLEFLSKKSKNKIALLYRFMAKGENEDDFFAQANKGKDYYPTGFGALGLGYDMAKWKTPSNHPAFFNTIKLSGKYNVIKGLDINSSISWTMVSGRLSGHSIDFSSAISYSIR